MCAAMFWSRFGPACLAPSACKSLLGLPKQPADLQLLNTTKRSKTRNKPFWSAFCASVGVHKLRKIMGSLRFCSHRGSTAVLVMQQSTEMCRLITTWSQCSWLSGTDCALSQHQAAAALDKTMTIGCARVQPLNPEYAQAYTVIHRLQVTVNPQLNTQQLKEIHGTRNWITQGCSDCSRYDVTDQISMSDATFWRGWISSTLHSKLAKLLWQIDSS